MDKKKEFTPSKYQQAVFDWVERGSGNAIVEAVAGSGKTTTIVEATKLMNGSVFLGAFNKKMADELKERTAGMDGVTAGTFHSAGFGCLRFFYGKKHALRVDNKKVSAIIDQLVGKDEAMAAVAPAAAAMVGMAKQRGLGTSLASAQSIANWVEMAERFDIDSMVPDGVPVEVAVRLAMRALEASNADLSVVDFDDMVYLPIQRGLKPRQHDWVLIDEAQDTNPTRRELARKLLRPGGRLVAVGDPRQAIFGFTGADNDSLDQIAGSFSCVRLPLSVTYRCPKAVVRHAQRWVSHIVAADEAPEGSVESADVKAFIEGAAPGDAAICRYNKYLVSAFFKLVRRGVPAKIEGRAVGQSLVALAKRWKVRSLDALVDRLDAHLDREVAKAVAKGKPDKADRVTDVVETLKVLIDNARDRSISTVDAFCEMVASMFEDDVKSGRVVTLCSAHRSKGLEWQRVWLLGREELMPSRRAVLPWQLEQEDNLIYVAVTRAKDKLIEVEGVAALSERKDR